MSDKANWVKLSELLIDPRIRQYKEILKLLEEKLRNKDVATVGFVSKVLKKLVEELNFFLVLEDVTIRKQDLYHSYILHCKYSNKPPVPDNVFGSHLIAKGIRKERRMVNRVREYCYVGIMMTSLPRLSRLP